VKIMSSARYMQLALDALIDFFDGLGVVTLSGWEYLAAQALIDRDERLPILVQALIDAVGCGRGRFLMHALEEMGRHLPATLGDLPRQDRDLAVEALQASVVAVVMGDVMNPDDRDRLLRPMHAAGDAGTASSPAWTTSQS
jgi:hypothetical protein